MQYRFILACIACAHAFAGASALAPRSSEKFLPGGLVAHVVQLEPVSNGNILHKSSHTPKTIEHEVARAELSHMWLRLLVCGVIVGCIFGMMGGGGALITKPMLYYIFHIQPFKMTIFTCYAILAPLSLFGVGLGQYKQCVVWADVARLFLCTSLVGTTLGAQIAQYVPDHVQLVLFALLILAVASYMWSKALAADKATTTKKESSLASAESSPPGFRDDWVYIATTATFIGVLTGMLGVGGGFMLTPLLCHIGHKMDTAVSTTLAVIFLNSVVGMAWYSHLFAMSIAPSDVTTVVSFVVIGCLGILASGHIASLMSSGLRQKIYASLLVAIGVGMVAVELIVA